MKLFCEVEGCGNELSEHCGSKGGLMICSRCRSSSYYAKRHGLAWARARRESLQFWTARLEYFEPRVLQLTNNAKRAVSDAKARARVALSKPTKKSGSTTAVH